MVRTFINFFITLLCCLQSYAAPDNSKSKLPDKRLVYSVDSDLTAANKLSDKTRQLMQQLKNSLMSEPAETEAIMRVLNFLHFAIDEEHEHKHSFKDWLKHTFSLETIKKLPKNYNVKRLGLNIRRAYNIESNDPFTKNHALNIATILPVTHTLEYTIVGLTVAATHFLDASGNAQVTAITTSIAIATADVICHLSMWTYAFKPTHKSFTKVRESLSRLAHKTIPYFKYNTSISGLERLNDRLLQQHERNQFSFHGTRNSLTVNLVPTGNRAGRMTMFFEEKNDVSYLKQLTFHDSEVDRQPALKLANAILGRAANNSKYALKQMVGQIAKDNLSPELEKKFYIESVDASAQQITFKDRAISIPRKTVKKSCAQVFFQFSPRPI